MSALRRSLLLLAFVGLFLVLLSITSEDSEASDVEVSFEEGIIVVYVDKSGSGPFYPEYMIEESPAFVDEQNDIRAIPEMEEYGDVYLNGSYIGKEGIVYHISDFPEGIHFEIFRNDYSISFNKNGGVGESIPSIIEIERGEYFVIPAVSYSKLGRYALVWNTSPDGTGEILSPGTHQMTLDFIRNHYSVANNNLVLYPKWVPIEYTIIFSSNGGIGNVPGQLSGLIISNGFTIQQINLSKTGYHSLVWNTESDGSGFDLTPGEKTLTEAMIGNCFGENDSVTLFPKWIANSYSISFESNGGTGAVPDDISNKTIGSSITIPSSMLSRTGYRMEGWNTRSNGQGVDVATGVTVLDSSVITALFGEGTHAVLYPKWVPIEYTVNFNSNNGTGQIPEPLISRTVLTGMTIPSVGLSRTGYSVSVWNTSADGTGNDIIPGDVTIDASLIQTIFTSGTSITLYPKWIPVEYSFSFNVNNGTGQTPDPLVSRTVITGATIPSVNISRTGYTATVWNTSPEGIGIDIVPGNLTIDQALIQSCFSNGTSITLYPKWIPIQYSFNFDANGGTGQVPGNLTSRNVLTGVMIPAIGLSRVGYSVSVWNTAVDGSGIDISPGNKVIDSTFIATYLPSSTTVTLYPKWIPIEYSISFNANQGTGEIPETIAHRTVITGVVIPVVGLSRAGHSVSVWNTAADGTGIDISPGSKTIDPEFIQNCFGLGTIVSLYPKWIPIEYSFSFNANQGTGESPDSLTSRTVLTGAVIPSVGFSRTGYSVSVWNTSPDGNGRDISPGNLVIDAPFIQDCFGNSTSVVLYPKWIPIQYSFSFDANSGSGDVPSDIASRTVLNGVVIPAIGLSRAGYSVTVWNTAADGSGQDIAPGIKTIDSTFIQRYFQSNTEVTLYPKWVPVEYTVSFNANNGTGQVPEALTSRTVLTGVTIPVIDLSRTGYSVSVWNTAADGNGTDMTPGDKAIDSEFIAIYFHSSTSITLYPKWVPIGYTIAFNANSGDGQLPNALTLRTILTGASIPSIELTRIGYSATVWNTSADGSGYDIRPGNMAITAAFIQYHFMSGTSMTLYPKWVPIEYSFSFDSNNGNGESPDDLTSRTVLTGATIPSIGLSRTGYSVSVWNTSPDGSGIDLAPGNVNIDGPLIQSCFGSNTSVVLYPKWMEKRYSISFDITGSAGDRPDTIENITIGSSVTIPSPSLIRTGYRMDGWNTLANGQGLQLSAGSRSLDVQMIESFFGETTSLMLYPRWIPVEYSFSFNANNGNGEVPSPIVSRTVITGVTIPTIDLSRIGYSVNVWNTAADGSGIDITPGSKAIDSGFIGSLFPSATSITLYPKWVPVEYSFSFDINQGSGQAPDPMISRTVLTGATIPILDLSRTGYTAVIWNTSADGNGRDIAPGNLVIDGTFIRNNFTSGTSITLYPKWVPIEYRISFNSNSGTGQTPGVLESRTVLTGVTIPVIGLSRTGYDVSVWNSSADGNGIDITPGSKTIDTEFIQRYFQSSTEITLYPKWTPIRYSFTFDANHGSGDIPDAMVSRTVLTGVVIPSVGLSRTGYRTSSWNTSPDGTGADISPGNNTIDESLIRTCFSAGTSVVLYPKWIPVEYTFSFDLNNGNGQLPGELTSRTVLTGVSIPSIGLTRAGYIVSTWNTSADGSGQDLSPGERTIDTELIQTLFTSGTAVTLYPKWVPKEYTISFGSNSGEGQVPAALVSRTVLTGAEIPSVGLSRIGYKVSVWNTSVDGTGIDISPGNNAIDESFIERCFGEGTSVVLYPKWVARSYSISFSSNGGEGRTPDTFNGVTIGTTITMPVSSFSRIGYRADGWSTTVDGSGRSFPPGSVLIDSAMISSIFGEGEMATLYQRWTPIEYSVSFSANNGSGHIPEEMTSRTVLTGIHIPAVEVTMVGYTASVWNTSADGNGRDIGPGDRAIDARFIEDNFTSGTSIMLYPKWVPIEYTFTFSANYGEGQKPGDLTSRTVLTGVQIPAVPLSRIGYSVSVWNTSADGSGIDIIPGSIGMDQRFIIDHFGSNTTLTLYPKWITVEYSFSFNANQGSGRIPDALVSRTVLTGAEIPEIGLSRIGYTVSVWNTSPEGNGIDIEPGNRTLNDSFIRNCFSSGTVVTLYPKWAPILYTVSFALNGGDGTLPDRLSNIVESSSIDVPAVDVRRTGYDSSIWNTSPDGSGIDISPGRNDVNQTFIMNCFSANVSVTLYPKWTENHYSITFSDNNGAPSPIEGLVIGNTITIPSHVYSRTGYEMDGWNTSADGRGTAFTIGSRVLESSLIEDVFGNGSSITLYPMWSKIDYSISFSLNGGNGPSVEAIRNITISSEMEIPEIQSRRTGYTSDIWNTMSDGTGVDVRAGTRGLDARMIEDCFGSDREITLYPRWVKIDYSISFDGNGVDSDIPGPLTGCRIGNSISIPSPTYTRTGYELSGWNTSSNGNGTDVPGGARTLDSATIEGLFGERDSIILYSKWMPIEYTIFLNSNGGEGMHYSTIRGITVTTGATIPSVTSVRTGYHSSVWNTAADGSGYDVSPGSNSLTDTFIRNCFGSNTSITLYPKWIESRYSILFDVTDINGTVPDPLINFTIGSVISIPNASFTRPGYDMGGWRTTGGEEFDPGDVTIDGEFIEGHFPNDPTMHLQPIWSLRLFTVTLTTECGSIEADGWAGNEGRYTNGYSIESETFGIPAPESDDRFHTFVRWEDDGGHEVVMISSGSVGDVYLHAVWIEREFVVNMNINGVNTKGSYTIDDELPVPEAEDGFSFKGWYYIDQNGVETEFTSMTQMYEGMSVYAVFEPEKDDPTVMIVLAAVLVSLFSVTVLISFRRR